MHILVKNSNAKKYFDMFYQTLKELPVKPSLPVYLGYYFGSPRKNNHIFYNTEQMTRIQNITRLLSNINKYSPLEIWDYSLANIEILKLHGIHTVKHVPLRCTDTYKNELLSYRTTIDFDVGFCGGLSPRRNEIIRRLRSAGISVNSLTEFGKKRDKQLARCRIILNIHAENNYYIFESARCEPWLSIGVPVVSEHSTIDDPRCINTSYESIVDTVKKELIAIKHRRHA